MDQARPPNEAIERKGDNRRPPCETSAQSYEVHPARSIGCSLAHSYRQGRAWSVSDAGWACVCEKDKIQV
jgi:hypothetical protein